MANSRKQNNEWTNADGLFIILLLITTTMWFYALLNFDDAWKISIFYVLLGAFTLILAVIDKTTNSYTGNILGIDMPINMYTFDNFSWKDLGAGIALGLMFAFVSTMTYGPVHSLIGSVTGTAIEGNILFAGVPSSAVSTFEGLTPFFRSLYIASVAIPENQVLSIAFAATFMQYVLFLFSQNGFVKRFIESFRLLLSFLFSLVGAFIAMVFHGSVYANQLNTLFGVFIFFFIGCFVTMIREDSSFFAGLHLSYNFSLLMFSVVPMAIWAF